MPNPIELQSPDGVLLYEFDWTDQIAEGVALVSVVHNVPPPLVKTAELADPTTGHSLVEIAGGVHRGLYVIDALATLTTGEQVPGSFTLRIMQPATQTDG